MLIWDTCHLNVDNCENIANLYTNFTQQCAGRQNPFDYYNFRKKAIKINLKIKNKSPSTLFISKKLIHHANKYFEVHGV